MSKILVFEGQTKGYTVRETAHAGSKHNHKHTCPDCRVLEAGMTVFQMKAVGGEKPGNRPGDVKPAAPRAR